MRGGLLKLPKPSKVNILRSYAMFEWDICIKIATITYKGLITTTSLYMHGNKKHFWIEIWEIRGEDTAKDALIGNQNIFQWECSFKWLYSTC